MPRCHFGFLNERGSRIGSESSITSEVDLCLVIPR